jgi:two-component system, OmpR family, alkaline phosphatase synthesis response regulator PhoP
VDPVVCFPDPAPAEVLLGLAELGIASRSAASPEQADALEAEVCEAGWSGAVVVAGEDLEAALATCAHLRTRTTPVRPLLLVLDEAQLGALPRGDERYDDFVVAPVRTAELAARLGALFQRTARPEEAELVEYGPLVINLTTYQAAVGGRVLDLTYMEYELLRFLATHPMRVFTREALLNRVWGYEYYGGARTVDVHVRRLRAKLGESHAGLISTVRSVGYRFGSSTWHHPA